MTALGGRIIIHKQNHTVGEKVTFGHRREIPALGSSDSHRRHR
jgi:hypothetical protein